MQYIYLYIANNIDWMEEWIEQCMEYYGTLTWEGVSKMIKTMHRHREEYPKITQREIDLACGLKDKKASIFTLLIFFHFFTLYQNIYLVYIFLYIYLPRRV